MGEGDDCEMKLCDYRGFEIRVPTSGGKAGRGNNVTSTVQVFDGVCIRKSIRFSMIDPEHAKRAARQAREFIDRLLTS